MSNKNISNELESLFSEWEKRLGTHFTKDGVMYQNGKTNEQVEQEWMASPIRVAFLLKDQHQFDSKTSNEDIRYWLKDMPKDNPDARENKKRNRNLIPPKFNNGKRARKSIFKPIAFLLWGLSKVGKGANWEFNDVKANLEEVKKFINSQPFALVECKKDPGGPECKDPILKQHIKHYGDLLKKEIEILNPNMIVCTNIIIYNSVKNMFPIDEITEFGDNPQLGKIAYHQKTSTFIFSSLHPSARRSYQYMYDYIIHNYRIFLQSTT
ncbi:MAG: hypothetical protein IJJ77_09420 [Paludibacteraceae bacterium]|nr:hypothetical protein [Paludibacteraceae bacterium]